MRVNLHVASLDPAQAAKLLKKSCEPSLGLGVRLDTSAQYGYAPHSRGLLRVSGERPSSRGTSNDFDEIAASHCSAQGSRARRY